MATFDSLNVSLKSALDEYLLFKGETLAESTLCTHRRNCAKFLSYTKNQGIQEISNVTAQLVIDFCQDKIYREVKIKSELNANLASMLQYFYERGDVSYGCSVIVHYLTTGKSQESFLNEVSSDIHMKIKKIMSCSDTLETVELLKYKEKLVQIHRENGYSKGMVTLNNRVIDLLILFLEINGYKYHPKIAMIWFDEFRSYFGKQEYSFRRALCLIADDIQLSSMSLTKMFRCKSPAFYLLPEWCMEAATRYVEIKTNEGWEKSTLDMIRSSITRFCRFLDQEGLRAFSELNASHIKRFNASDIHKTPQGKNAYNIRIRKFLIFLGENDYLNNAMLFIALPCTSAPKETIVVILTEEEMEELNRQFTRDDSRLSLRKKAMLLLGLKMGLRASDVVNLTVDDINWNSASIRFIQKKTSVEINLPMPTEVGNALFRYITEERGSKSSPQIFLSEKAPRTPVGRAVCRSALKTALPDRNVEGSGFHVTRKTYATTLLRNGVGAAMVSEALGQRGTSSVHRYLSLDTDRMRMCPLSLSECKIDNMK